MGFWLYAATLSYIVGSVSSLWAKVYYIQSLIDSPSDVQCMSKTMIYMYLIGSLMHIYYAAVQGLIPMLIYTAITAGMSCHNLGSYDTYRSIMAADELLYNAINSIRDTINRRSSREASETAMLAMSTTPNIYIIHDISGNIAYTSGPNDDCNSSTSPETFSYASATSYFQSSLSMSSSEEDIKPLRFVEFTPELMRTMSQSMMLDEAGVSSAGWEAETP